MTGSADDPDMTGPDVIGETEGRGAGPPICPHCHEVLYKRHCKYICPQHGPIIDCSDPFR
jgi:hypothetical protein